MKARAERLGSAVVIHLEGRLTVESDTKELHRLVESAAGQGIRALVLDLKAVPRLDCCGIGELVRIHNLMFESGGAIALVDVSSRDRELLGRVGLLRVFPVLETLPRTIRWNEVVPEVGCHTRVTATVG